MRGLAVALAFVTFSVPAAAGQTGSKGRVAFLDGHKLVVLDLATGKRTVALAHAPPGPIRWSGDGKLLSDGGRVVGGPALPTDRLVWAPSGETAAYERQDGTVVVWSPGRSRTAVPGPWGATSLAWGPNGALALGRYVCHVPCGIPLHQEVWIWQDGSLRRVAGPLRGVVRPVVTGFTGDGRVLWWADIQGSASLSADGLTLYANRTRIGRTLVFPDYVVRCGSHLALAAGGDRYATLGKRILLDGRDVSRDGSRSWVSPSCNPTTSSLVAAASRSREESRFGAEHRAIWQVLPTRRQLTRPPPGRTDEDPTVLANGSILFVRTKQSARKMNGEWVTTTRGVLELLAHGKLQRIASLSFSASDSSAMWLNYYGHYNWPERIAVAP